jgi:hypothetical protein
MFFAWLNNLCAINGFMLKVNCPEFTEFVMLNCSKKTTSMKARMLYYGD